MSTLPDRWIVDDPPSDTYPLYTRANVGEVFPDPVSALSWTLAARPGAEQGWRDALVRYGAFDHDEFSDAHSEILACFGGYAYLNVSITRVFGVRTPGLTPEQVDYSLWGEMPGIAPYQARPTDESPAHSARIAETLQWIFTIDSLPDLADDQRQMRELRVKRPDVSALGDAELLDRTRELMGKWFRYLFAQHLYTSYCALVPAGVIAQVTAELGDPTLAMRLVSSLGGVDSAAPSFALWDLGRLVAGSKALTRAFDEGVPGLGERLRASSDADGSRFLAGFDRFLDDYGSRGPNEWEMRSPSWEIRPELALAAVDRMRLTSDRDAPQVHHDKLAAERAQLSEDAVAKLAGNPEGQAQFQGALRAASVFFPGRERTKTTIIMLVHECRVLMQELGRRMVDAGHFEIPGSFAMLMNEEFDDFLADPGSWARTIREREEVYARLEELSPPFIMDARAGDPPPLGRWSRRDEHTVELAGAGDVLAGIPGCPGRATGRARVILDPSDPSALEPGDVLVAPITDPAWTPLFCPAGAVVVDVGAQVSHAVIVSRELGIPCVVSVTDGTMRIPDGATVTVDGTAGTVTIH